MDSLDRRVKIHREEMESLLNLKSKLDHEGAVSSYAAKYQQLGWVLQALNPQDGTFLTVDTGADPETWVNRLWEPGLPGPVPGQCPVSGKRIFCRELGAGAG